jgi:hypothetical protein
LRIADWGIGEIVKIVEDVEIIEVDHLAHSSQKKPNSDIEEQRTGGKMLSF